MVNSAPAEALECAYIERGPVAGPPVLLIHGFPDDARTWDTVASALADDGYRTIAPFLRGFGRVCAWPPGRARSRRSRATCSTSPTH